MISFSVIVPTCHRNDDLERCLKRLQVVNPTKLGLGDSAALIVGRQRFQYEVIVTDDGTQTTAEGLVRETFPWVKWVKGPHRGPAANRNCGASQASGDWLVFIDDDCIPGSGWLRAYALAILDFPECAVFEGRTVPQGIKTRADQECPINLKGGYLWSCNFSIKRSLFLELGGFDDKFSFSLEDMDFKIRLDSGRHPIKFVSEAQAEHPWRPNRDIRFCITLAKSIDYFTANHPSAKKMFAEAWGINRMIRIIDFEFPRNLLPHPHTSSFRTSYFDL